MRLNRHCVCLVYLAINYHEGVILNSSLFILQSVNKTNDEIKVSISVGK